VYEASGRKVFFYRFPRRRYVVRNLNGPAETNPTDSQKYTHVFVRNSLSSQITLYKYTYICIYVRVCVCVQYANTHVALFVSDTVYSVGILFVYSFIIRFARNLMLLFARNRFLVTFLCIYIYIYVRKYDVVRTRRKILIRYLYVHAYYRRKWIIYSSTRVCINHIRIYTFEHSYYILTDNFFSFLSVLLFKI